MIILSAKINNNNQINSPLLIFLSFCSMSYQKGNSSKL